MHLQGLSLWYAPKEQQRTDRGVYVVPSFTLIMTLIESLDVCYKPASLITPELLALKLKMLEAMMNTVRISAF